MSINEYMTTPEEYLDDKIEDVTKNQGWKKPCKPGRINEKILKKLRTSIPTPPSSRDLTISAPHACIS